MTCTRSTRVISEWEWRETLQIIGSRGRAAQRRLNDTTEDDELFEKYGPPLTLPSDGFDSIVYLPSSTYDIPDSNELIEKHKATDLITVESHDLHHFFLVLSSPQAARAAVGEPYRQRSASPGKMLSVSAVLMRRLVSACRKHDYESVRAILGSLTRYAKKHGVTPVPKAKSVQAKDDAPLYLNDSTHSELLCFAALPNHAAKEILRERRRGPKFVTWTELEKRVDSMTPRLSKKLQELGVRLTKESLFLAHKRKFLMVGSAHPDLCGSEPLTIEPEIGRTEPRFRQENKGLWPQLPDGGILKRSGGICDCNDGNSDAMIDDDESEDDYDDEAEEKDFALAPDAGDIVDKPMYFTDPGFHPSCKGNSGGLQEHSKILTDDCFLEPVEKKLEACVPAQYTGQIFFFFRKERGKADILEKWGVVTGTGQLMGFQAADGEILPAVVSSAHVLDCPCYTSYTTRRIFFAPKYQHPRMEYFTSPRDFKNFMRENSFPFYRVDSVCSPEKWEDLKTTLSYVNRKAAKNNEVFDEYYTFGRLYDGIVAYDYAAGFLKDDKKKKKPEIDRSLRLSTGLALNLSLVGYGERKSESDPIVTGNKSPFIGVSHFKDNTTHGVAKIASLSRPGHSGSFYTLPSDDGETHAVAIHAAQWSCNRDDGDIRRTSYAALVTTKMVNNFKAFTDQVQAKRAKRSKRKGNSGIAVDGTGKKMSSTRSSPQRLGTRSQTLWPPRTTPKAKKNHL